MSNEQLVMLIKAGDPTGEYMEALYLQVKRFIYKTASRYQGRAELEDLEQEGYLALYPAIHKYDPDKGVKFLTYAEYYISQRMRRYILANKNSVRLPYHSYEQIAKYRKFYNLFFMRYGREPSDEDAEYCIHLTLDEIREIRRNILLDNVKSLDAYLTDEEDTTTGEMIASGENLEEDAAERMDQELLQSVLWPMVDRLPGIQPDVIRKLYQQCMKTKDIGDLYGLSTREVRREKEKGLRELLKPCNIKVLRSFFPETAEAQAYRGNGVERFNQTWTSSTERIAMQLYSGRQTVDKT